MEKNFISEWQQTCFYVNLESRTYGVCVNIKDIDNAEQIINDFKEERKEQIEAWKKEWGVEYGI